MNDPEHASPARRNLSLDVFKVALAVMVVCFHCGLLTDLAPYAAQIFLANGLFRIAVPCFLIINGYFLARQLDSNLGAWLRRLGFLYAFWMVIYAPFWLPPAAVQSLAASAADLVFGYWHLWYVAGLVTGGLLLAPIRHLGWGPLLAVAAFSYGIGYGLELAYFAGAWPAWTDSWPWWQTVRVYRNGLFAGLPFLVLGLLIRRHAPQDRLSMPVLYGLAATGLALLFLESAIIETLLPGSWLDLALMLLLVCPVLMMIVLRLDMPGASKSLALFAAALYFVHMAWILVLEQHFEIAGTPLTAIVLPLSAATAWLALRLNRRLPIL